MAAIARTVAPGGRLFLRCSLREEDEPAEGRPWPLSRAELRAFVEEGLREVAAGEGRGQTGGRVLTVVYARP
jgi:hypothetical protein